MLSRCCPMQRSAVQKEIKPATTNEVPENRRMQFRIGVNFGDVIQEEDPVYGDGVYCLPSGCPA